MDGYAQYSPATHIQLPNFSIMETPIESMTKDQLQDKVSQLITICMDEEDSQTRPSLKKKLFRWVDSLEKGVLGHFSSKVDESDQMIEKETRRINREKENALQKCELISPGFKRQAKKRVRREEEEAEDEEDEEDEEDDEEEMANSVLAKNLRNQSVIARESMADKRRRGRVPELRVGDLVTVKYNKVAMDAYIIKYSKGKYDVRYIETKKIQRNFTKKYLFAKVL